MRRSKRLLVFHQALALLIVVGLIGIPASALAQDAPTDPNGGSALPLIFMPLLTQNADAQLQAEGQAPLFVTPDGVLPAQVAPIDPAANPVVDATHGGGHGHGGGPDNERGQDKAIFFVADGLRQDLVEKYAGQRQLPAMGALLRSGAKAGDNGLLTQAPPNTGAGWYSLATGAWSGVHGSTNNTFHINGAPFTNRTAAFDAGVLQAETLAQSAERGGKKVVQFEWAGGRGGVINGPTVDFRTFYSGRGVSTNYISPTDDAAFVAAFGLQFDHPAGFAGQAPFAGATPVDATGWSNVPTSFSPAKEMRLRILDAGVDKYGLNAYIFDSTHDKRVNYDRVLFAPGKDGAAKVAVLRKGQWGDIKVKIVGGAQDGLTAGLLVKVEELSRDLSQVRLFHASVARAIASWPTWTGEAGFTGDFAEFVAQKFPTSTAADFAILEAGIVSEETYVEQGLYWEASARRWLH
ncbi:MAG: alkaline phosphatase family protein [Anaerolineales bacterium]|nr:alkaline phosphatase family protein [Anaerolineales bacterium]